MPCLSGYRFKITGNEAAMYSNACMLAVSQVQMTTLKALKPFLDISLPA